MKEKAQDYHVQKLVLERAAGFVAGRGPKGWNTDELAKACGMAKNTLYKIIGSKEKIVEKIVLEQITATTRLLNHIIENSDGYREATKRMMIEAPPFFSERPRITFAEIFLEYPAIEKKARDQQQALGADIIQFIEKGQAEGFIRNDVEPKFLYDLIQGVVDHYVRSGYKGADLSKALFKAFLCLSEGIRLGE